VRSLAAELNIMVREIEELVESQRSFAADASHQLRTPLTALRLRLENLSHEISTGGRPQLEGAAVEAERLERIVEGLLVLARAEAPGNVDEPVPLAHVVEGRTDAWTAYAAEREVSLESSVPAEVVVVATADRLEQALDNLLANALAVAPRDSSVKVVWANDELHVLERGPGMTEDELRHAFDRFWRARPGDGSGLGLAIVRRLVEADGGSIELRKREGGGIDAAIRFRAVTTSRRELAGFAPTR
jgi:signal transduction histidine kinase